MVQTEYFSGWKLYNVLIKLQSSGYSYLSTKMASMLTTVWLTSAASFMCLSLPHFLGTLLLSSLANIPHLQ